MRKGEGINLKKMPIGATLTKAHLEELLEDHKICSKCQGTGEVYNGPDTEEPCQLYFSRIDEVKNLQDKFKAEHLMSFSAAIRRIVLKKSGHIKTCKKCKGEGITKKNRAKT